METNSTIQPKASIDWSQTEFCMDHHCECGRHNHFDDHGQNFQYVQCADCKTVFGLEPDLRLFEREPGDESVSVRPNDLPMPIFIQWKGSEAKIDVNCKCGETFTASGMFLYHVTCTSCGAHYETDCHIGARPLTKEEEARGIDSLNPCPDVDSLYPDDD